MGEGPRGARSGVRASKGAHAFPGLRRAPAIKKETPDSVGARPPYPLLADREDVVVFQTPPLDSAMEVTGPIEVILWVSSSATDTDFTARLVDVCPATDGHPEGYHLPLADSILRVRFRDGFDHEELMTPGQSYRITIELPPISNVFGAGHRIRVDVASSNFPAVSTLTPNTGEADRPSFSHYSRHEHRVRGPGPPVSNRVARCAYGVTIAAGARRTQSHKGWFETSPYRSGREFIITGPGEPGAPIRDAETWRVFRKRDWHACRA